MIHESRKEDPKALVFSGDFGDITDEQTRQTVHINVLDQLQRKFLARNKDGNHLFKVIDVQYPEETGGTVDAQQEPVLVKVVEKRRYPLHDRTGIFVVNTRYQVMWCLDEVTCTCNKQVLAGFPCMHITLDTRSCGVLTKSLARAIPLRFTREFLKIPPPIVAAISDILGHNYEIWTQTFE